MINKNDFLKETEEYSKDVQKKLLELYNRNEIITDSKEHDLKTFSLIKDIMIDLFNPTGSFNEPLIPFSFFQTAIGRVVISAMGGMDNRRYTIIDLIEMTKTPERPKGYTQQYLIQEIKDGRLNATKEGRIWLVPHSEVERYLKAKGILKE